MIVNQKLFMVYIGGHMPTSNVEVHDVRFVVGETIEDCYSDLQAQWWGEADSLHLDCWGEVRSAGDYEITLSEVPAEDESQKLFFVNLGGYDPGIFDELHKNVVVVAPSEPKAKEIAKDGIRHWKVPHKDTLFEVEKALDVSSLLRKHGLYIHVKKTARPLPFEFECLYTPISEKALAKKKRKA
jgi:hypothetical protein